MQKHKIKKLGAKRKPIPRQVYCECDTPLPYHSPEVTYCFKCGGLIPPERIKEKIIEIHKTAPVLPIDQVTPRVVVTFLEQINIDHAIKGSLNFIFSRLTGFRLFKEFTKSRSSSFWDKLIELINLIIKKLKEVKK